MSIFDKIKTAVDNAYHHLLPKPASEYTKAGITVLARFTKYLDNSANAAWLAVKSILASSKSMVSPIIEEKFIPANSKSMCSVISKPEQDLAKAQQTQQQTQQNSINDPVAPTVVPQYNQQTNSQAYTPGEALAKAFRRSNR